MPHIDVSNLVRRKLTKHEKEWVEHNPWMKNTFIPRTEELGIVLKVCVKSASTKIDILLSDGTILTNERTSSWEIFSNESR